MMKCLKNRINVKKNNEKIKLNYKLSMVPKKKQSNKNKTLMGFKIRKMLVKEKVKAEQA